MALGIKNLCGRKIKNFKFLQIVWNHREKNRQSPILKFLSRSKAQNRQLGDKLPSLVTLRKIRSHVCQ